MPTIFSFFPLSPGKRKIVLGLFKLNVILSLSKFL